MNRRLVQRGNWDPERLIKAQEYVSRRLDFLKVRSPARLNRGAIAVIFELRQALSKGDADPDIAENVGKAIKHFRKSAGSRELLENIERAIPDWTFPTELTKIRNSVNEKQG